MLGVLKKESELKYTSIIAAKSKLMKSRYILVSAGPRTERNNKGSAKMDNKNLLLKNR